MSESVPQLLIVGFTWFGGCHDDRVGFYLYVAIKNVFCLVNSEFVEATAALPCYDLFVVVDFLLFILPFLRPSCLKAIAPCDWVLRRYDGGGFLKISIKKLSNKMIVLLCERWCSHQRGRLCCRMEYSRIVFFLLNITIRGTELIGISASITVVSFIFLPSLASYCRWSCF